MQKSPKLRKWVIVIGSNAALLAAFLLIVSISSVCRPVTRIVACMLYAVLWGINSGMLIYREFKAADPVAFSHSKVANVINNITLVGVLILCGIFFMVS